MLPRDTPRPPVKAHSPRYATVDLGDHGPHPLRGPTFAGDDLLGRLAEESAADWTAPDGSPARLRQMSPMMGAAVGSLWWHPDLDLEAVQPRWTAPTADWLAFGEQVCDEMVEQGYTLSDLVDLYLGSMRLVNAGISVVQEADTRADFSSAPEEPATLEAQPPSAEPLTP